MSNVTLEAEFMPFDGSGAAPTSARLHARTAATAASGSSR